MISHFYKTLRAGFWHVVAMIPQASVIPGRVYRDAPKAIEWLCQVFGFEKHAVYPGEGNTILHAELTLGSGMLMLGSTKEPIATDEAHGVNLIVQDADAVYERALAAKAQIVHPIEGKPYGGRGFSCRDGEGYSWHVGTYNPWLPK